VRLPNADHALIEVEKLRDYLLHEDHPQNRGKARLFAALGYTRENWPLLEGDIRTQHLNQEAITVGPRPYGEYWKVEANLQAR
jgi:hypothetical protein